MAEKKDKQYVSGNAQLMIEWNWELNTSLGLNPKELLTGSNKKAWWTCRNGHTWDAVIVTRVKGSGCPFCSNRRAWKGFNDLLTTHPFLASQWHPTMNGQLSASDVTSGSDKKVWWRCPDCGHEWESRVANRTLGNGCPVCRNAIISKKVSQIHLSKSGSLKDTHPQLAKQWHTKKMEHFYRLMLQLVALKQCGGLANAVMSGKLVLQTGAREQIALTAVTKRYYGGLMI